MCGCSKFDMPYINLNIPVVLNSIDSISDSSCTITAKIDDLGKDTILYQGVCWSTTPNPVYDSSAHLLSTTNGSPFSLCFKGLNPRTTYYVRAFAANDKGIGYGDQITITTPAKSPFTYGQFYAGGFIFYIDSTGNHGLVCDTTDLKDSVQIRDTLNNLVAINYYDSIQWRTNSGADTSGASATAISTYTFNVDSFNTVRIMALDSSPHNAASICFNYRGGGYTNWYLPSKDELNNIYLNLTARGIGNMSPTTYWSSSNYITTTNINAWAQYFGNGNQYYFNESFYLNVRAVRAF